MGHFYLHNGQRLPSPTTILGECIDKSGAMAQAAVNETLNFIVGNPDLKGITDVLINKNKVSEYKKKVETCKYHYANVWKKQRTIGSITHRAIAIYLRNGHLYNSHYAEVQNTIKAFLSFAKDFKLKPLHTEYQVYGNFCAGTVDLKGMITIPKGKNEGKEFLYILDWKTNKAFYGRTHMLQSAKYAQLDGDTDLYGAVRLDKYSGEYEFKDGGLMMPYSRKPKISDLRRFNAYMIAYMENHQDIAKGCNWKLNGEINKLLGGLR